MDKKIKKGIYYECLKCGDRIYYDTNKKMVYCKCKAIAIDGCEFYTRINGNKEDYKSVYINEDGKVEKRRYYIIFDLEATCWKEKSDKPKEIIEIGAVKLNENLVVVNSFSKFVKPTINPVLSNFCKTLTSIQQKDIDNAQAFNEAVASFEKWISPEDDILLISWGYYDKKQILEESSVKNYSGEIIKLLEEKHISLKHEFAKMRKEKPCGMKKALNKLNLPLEGTHHRGIDDAKNIARIFKVVFSELADRI